MSTLNDMRRHLGDADGREEPSYPRRIGRLAMLFTLMLGAIVGAAELHLLPIYSADDIGSIVFEAG